MISKTFAETQLQSRRLTLLQGLHNTATYRANVQLLRRYCDSLGHVASFARIETDLAWLSEQDLVKVTQEQGVSVAVLTAHGQDVATGRAKVPGVDVPAAVG